MSGMLSAARGILGSYEPPPVFDRFNISLEQARDELATKIAGVIGKKLTQAEIAKLSSDQALELIQFEVDKVLTKVARWQK